MSLLQLGGEELYRKDQKPAKSPSLVTLTADLNRYREIEVFGCTDEWIRCSCRLFKPSSAGTSDVWDMCHFVLQAQNIAGGKVYNRWTNWTISQSGTSIKFTPDQYYETCFNGTGVETYGSSGIQIVRLSGWI